MTRHLGTFIQNTIKPLLEQAERLLDKHMHLESIINKLIVLEILKTIVYSFMYIILGVLFCLTVYFILR